MRRPLPDIPWVSAFPELNLRLYVEHDGMPGVWFLSLDATNPFAVWAAKTFFHLPYWHSRITFTKKDDRVEYHCRSSHSLRRVNLSASYRPISEPTVAAEGSLEQFLMERYRLYCRSRDGRLYRCQVHHKPWPLQVAEATISADSLLAPHGLTLPATQPLLHFSKGVEVVVWSLDEIKTGLSKSKADALRE